MRVVLADGLDIQEEKIIDRLQKIFKLSPWVVRQLEENCNDPIR
ncbi:hypothetical protein [Zarconia navalis]|nr:hypothetical protein [Zarconia navalis]